MEHMSFVKKENTSKAEDAIRKDFDLAAKQSITVRDAHALGIKKDGSFFYITGSDEGVKKCITLIKPFEEKMDKKDADVAKKKIIEEADSAAAGMGSIFG